MGCDFLKDFLEVEGKVGNLCFATPRDERGGGEIDSEESECERRMGSDDTLNGFLTCSISYRA